MPGSFKGVWEQHGGWMKALGGVLVLVFTAGVAWATLNLRADLQLVQATLNARPPSMNTEEVQKLVREVVTDRMQAHREIQGAEWTNAEKERAELARRLGKIEDKLDQLNDRIYVLTAPKRSASP